MIDILLERTRSLSLSVDTHNTQNGDISRYKYHGKEKRCEADRVGVDDRNIFR